MQIFGSINGGSTWQPLCGKYETAPASFGGTTPMYDGLQELFAKEEMNLSDYLGQNLLIRFTLTSDNFENQDGFYFDEFLVRKLTATTSDVKDIALNDNIRMYPNPSNGQVTLSNTSNEKWNVVIYNELGQAVLNNISLYENQAHLVLDLSNLESGLYFIELSNGSQKTVKKLALNR